jgi:hypothetical protein
LADDGMKIKFDLDAEGAISQIEQLSNKLNMLTNGESMLALAEKIGGLMGPIGLVATAIFAWKESLDLAAEGEALQRIEDQFNSLAVTAGVSSDAMKSGLEAATHGLMTTTDAMKMASKAMVELGANAGAIPQLFELSQKAAMVMGVDTEQAFNTMSQAVASGNTRMLRHLGIIIDQKKAYKDFADQAGITVGEMTQFQRSQAVLNETLAQGGQKFKDISLDSDTMLTANKRLSTSWKEFNEEIVRVFAEKIGPSAAKATNSLSESVQTLTLWLESKFSSGAKKSGSEIELLERKIKSLREEMTMMEKIGAGKGDTARPQALASLQKELDIKKAIQEEDRKAGRGMSPEEEEKRAKKIAEMDEAEKNRKTQQTAEEKLQADNRLLRETKFAEDMNKINKSINDDKMKYETDSTNFHMEQIQQQALLDKDYALKEQDLQNELNIKKTITDDEYVEKSLALEEERANKIREMNEKQKDEEINLQNNRVKYAQTASKGVSAAFSQGAAVARKNMNDFGARGQQVFQAVNKSAVGFFKGLGAGSQSAAELMKTAVFGALASMAQQQGEYLMAVGLGTMNPVAMAEGGALLALAGYLESQGGAGATSSGSGGGGGGGGVTGAPSGIDIGTAPNASQATGKAVSIQIQGSYFETEQTQRRLVDLVRQETDATSYTYSQVGVK